VSRWGQFSLSGTVKGAGRSGVRIGIGQESRTRLVRPPDDEHGVGLGDHASWLLRRLMMGFSARRAAPPEWSMATGDGTRWWRSELSEWPLLSLNHSKDASALLSGRQLSMDGDVTGSVNGPVFFFFLFTVFRL
jgi:hypothetical protein